MLQMRVSLLLLLVPAIAWADTAPPRATTELAVGDRTVTVGFGADDKIHVRVAGGGELTLEPAGRAYVARDQWKVDAALAGDVAPVPLVKVSSRPEACSDYWDIYVSVVDGVPRAALALYSMADPPSMQTSTVKLARDGSAVVTVRTEEDGKHVRTTRTRYRFDGRVYVAVPKRGAARSK